MQSPKGNDSNEIRCKAPNEILNIDYFSTQSIEKYLKNDLNAQSDEDLFMMAKTLINPSVKPA